MLVEVLVVLVAERETLLLELVHHGVDDEADAEPERAVEERRTGAHERTDVDQKLLRQRNVPDVPLLQNFFIFSISTCN